MSPDHVIEFYKVEDVDDQLEWRDMTETCRPKEKENCLVWQAPGFITCAVMYWHFDDGVVKWRHHMHFKHYWSDDQINGSKWLRMLPNPWDNKQ